MTEEVWKGYKIKIRELSPPSGNAPPGNNSVFSTAAPAPHEPTLLDDALQIDGETIPVLKAADGYRIFHMPPSATMIEAARAYVDVLGGKQQ